MPNELLYYLVAAIIQSAFTLFILQLLDKDNYSTAIFMVFIISSFPSTQLEYSNTSLAGIVYLGTIAATVAGHYAYKLSSKKK